MSSWLINDVFRKNIKIRPFDEVFGAEASRALVIQKLKEASLKPNRSWLYNIENPGKFYLRDGRTGDFFDNAVTVGAAYILKLIHLVEDKIHSRALGPYNKITNSLFKANLQAEANVLVKWRFGR